MYYYRPCFRKEQAILLLYNWSSLYHSLKMSQEARLYAKRHNENLKRRIDTLFINAYKLWDDFGIDIGIFLKNQSQYYSFRTIDKPNFLPTIAEIVSNTIVLNTR
jgi:hypothetical protein